MPSEFGPAEASQFRVAVAPVLEFQFGLFLLRKHTMDPEKWVPPWVIELTAQRRPLVEQLVNFWKAPGLDNLNGAPYRECGELLVACWHQGALFSASPDAMLASLEGTFARGVPVPPLDSEPLDVMRLIEKRLKLLEQDATLRSAYVEIVRELFAAMRPYWDAGREAAERTAEDLIARARGESDLRTLIPGNTWIHKEASQPHILAARDRGELVIVPLGLAGGGQFYWSFPGVVLIGVGVDSAERQARRKERAERAANRLKVLSDPTRVAILFELLGSSHHAATVTELASQFGLSQPTVSVHIKLLREAGLARPERDGNQVRYQAEEGTVRAYVGEALEDIIGATR